MSSGLRLLRQDNGQACAFGACGTCVIGPRSLSIGRSRRATCRDIHSTTFFDRAGASLNFFLGPFAMVVGINLRMLDEAVGDRLRKIPSSLNGVHGRLGVAFLHTCTSPRTRCGRNN